MDFWLKRGSFEGNKGTEEDHKKQEAATASGASVSEQHKECKCDDSCQYL
jgi:hypothetical protein